LGLSHGPPDQANHGRATIYAIIRAGGKQYRVQPEQTIDIDRVAADAGAMVEFREVLLVGGDGDVLLGTPFVEGARVVAEVLDQGRGKKILVFKYKNKTRYRRRRGHRQAYTRLAIRQILTDGKASAADAEEKPSRTSRRRATPKAKAGAAETAKAPAPEAPVAVAETKPRRTKKARASASEAATGTGAPLEEAAPAPDAGVKPTRRARTKKTTDSGE
jgi:large subunit ribosomal protein L21